jgi:hypothetical protein
MDIPIDMRGEHIYWLLGWYMHAMIARYRFLRGWLFRVSDPESTRNGLIINLFTYIHTYTAPVQEIRVYPEIYIASIILPDCDPGKQLAPDMWDAEGRCQPLLTPDRLAPFQLTHPQW